MKSIHGIAGKFDHKTVLEKMKCGTDEDRSLYQWIGYFRTQALNKDNVHVEDEQYVVEESDEEVNDEEELAGSSTEPYSEKEDGAEDFHKQKTQVMLDNIVEDSQDSQGSNKTILDLIEEEEEERIKTTENITVSKFYRRNCHKDVDSDIMSDTSANLSDTDTEMQAQNKVTVEHLTMVEEDEEVDELKEDSELDQDKVESSNGESEGNGDDGDEEGSGEEGESTQDDTDDSQIQLDDMMIAVSDFLGVTYGDQLLPAEVG